MFYPNNFDNYRPQILYTNNVIGSLTTHIPQSHHSHNIHLNQSQSIVANGNNSVLQSQPGSSTQSNSNTIYQYRPHHQHSPNIVAHQYENFPNWSNTNQLHSPGNDGYTNHNTNNSSNQCIQSANPDNRLSQQQTYENLNVHSSSNKSNTLGNNTTLMHLNSNISIHSRLDSANSNVNPINSSSNSSRETNNHRNNSIQVSQDQGNIDWTHIPQEMQLGDNGKEFN
jgi:hypothetical protein